MSRPIAPRQEGISVIKMRFVADALQLRAKDEDVSQLDDEERRDAVFQHFSKAARALTRVPGRSDRRIRKLVTLHPKLQRGLDLLERETRFERNEVLHSFFAGREPFAVANHLCTETPDVRETTRWFLGNFQDLYDRLPDDLREKCEQVATAHDGATVEDLLMEAVYAFVYVGPFDEGEEAERITEGIDHIERTLRRLKPHFI